MKVGERVGVALGTRGRKVIFIGWGVYEGRHPVADDAVGFRAEMKQCVPMDHEDRLNPRIRLDDGSVVWGCECWWGPEAIIKERLDGWRSAGYEVVTRSIADIRAEVRGTGAGA